MGKYVRLVDYKSFDEKEKEFFNESNIYSFDKTKYENIPDMAFAYQISENLYDIFCNAPRMESISEPKVGLQTGKNDLYYREWVEVDINKISFESDRSYKWFPCIKGGETRKWYGNFGTIINWQKDGAAIKKESGSVVRNPDYYFRKGLTWTKISSIFAIRMYPEGMIMTDASVFVFPKDDLLVMGCLNSSVMPAIVGALNPTLNFIASTVAVLPMLFPEDKDEVRKLVEDNIELSRQEWDSSEYSWNFTQHFLMPKNDNKCIEDIYYIEEKKRKAQIEKMRTNEERINQIFIDVYKMSGEVKANVDEVSIKMLDKREAVISLISYAIGCVMGRYSINQDGIVFAGGNWNETKYSKTFKPCEYGVMPITEEQYFEEDLCTKVIDFIRIVYGEENLKENLNFIGKALKEDSFASPKKIIREFIFNEFFDYHYQMYQKRPFYWQLDSGKAGGFRAIVYMHRYNENTLSLVRTEYIQDLRYKYEDEMQRQQRKLSDAKTTAEKNAIKKEINALDKKMVECSAYDDLLNHVTSSIQNYVFDLDDGVKTNYAKFLSIDGDKNKNILTVIKL